MTAGATLAEQVTSGAVQPAALATASLHAIARLDGEINSFITVLDDRASEDARTVREVLANGGRQLALAGLPYAAKDLFAVAGRPTSAGSRISTEDPPAPADAEPVARMRRAGAVLVGLCNMDEYAYGFSTENAHYGPCRNPHDRARIAGGSSGGSAAAVAAGIVPIALASDTNGSVRVPAALCGIYGIRPTPGTLPRTGMFPLSSSLDTVGVLARTPGDLRLAHRALAGDPSTAERPCEGRSGVALELGRLRIAGAGGYFRHGATAQALASVDAMAQALGADELVELPSPERARGAAMIITACEAAAVHLPNLRTRPQDFDPMTRDRLLAGAMIPAHAYVRARRLRRELCARARRLMHRVDVVLAPATPFSAPYVGEEFSLVAGERVPTRLHLGRFTQPISLLGLPVVSVPAAGEGLPLGVQLVGAPGREATLLALAEHLTEVGLTRVPTPLQLGHGTAMPAIDRRSQAARR